MASGPTFVRCCPNRRQDLSPLDVPRQAGPPLQPRSATMQDNANSELPAPKHTPWNKGKLTGAKPPLRQKHVWAIRTKLQIEQRTRDLALFNLAIDSKLRGCDVVSLMVEDVAPNGYSVERATVRQKKTCLLYTSPSPRDRTRYRMPSSA